MRLGEFSKLWAGYQVRSGWWIPVHLTRYWIWFLWRWELRIFSTSHSCCSWMITGGGGVCWCPGMGSVLAVGLRRLMWKTGWILTVAGRSSLYALEPTFSRVVYGPICLWSSLFDGRVVRMCFRRSQTLSPGFSTGSGCHALLACSA